LFNFIHQGRGTLMTVSFISRNHIGINRMVQPKFLFIN